MPAHRRSAKPKGDRRLPRITDPYAPPSMDDDAPAMHQELLIEEKARAAQNAKVWRLVKQLEKARTANASIADEHAREEANWTISINRQAFIDIGTTQGRADCHDHPDMVAYFAAATAFRQDFGHHFSCDDGLDYHLKQMASHAATADALSVYNAEELLDVVSSPLTFTVYNPYPEGDAKHERFNAKLHALTIALHGERTLDNFAMTVKTTFSFTLLNPYAKWLEWRVQQHYHRVWIQDEIVEMARHHMEDYEGIVGEKREDTCARLILSILVLLYSKFPYNVWTCVFKRLVPSLLGHQAFMCLAQLGSADWTDGCARPSDPHVNGVSTLGSDRSGRAQRWTLPLKRWTLQFNRRTLPPKSRGLLPAIWEHPWVYYMDAPVQCMGVPINIVRELPWVCWALPAKACVGAPWVWRELPIHIPWVLPPEASWAMKFKVKQVYWVVLAATLSVFFPRFLASFLARKMQFKNIVSVVATEPVLRVMWEI
ncbi:hypothetical protein C8R44DRAFT_753417 [Mycena epipterygia]|nr:hypothetical protein C8R44DRAFT_753417 [Mycena epipterygia]